MDKTLKFGILFLLCFVASPLNLRLRVIEHEASFKTPLFGTNNIGAPFSWKSKLARAEIREITGKNGWHIDQIKVRTFDGSQEEMSPNFGGYGKNPYTWKVPNGEHITKILYRKRSWLDGVTFVTNKGTQSPQFGGLRGNGQFTYNLPYGSRLSGIYGYKDQYIRSLGFFIETDFKSITKTRFDGDYNKETKFEWIFNDLNRNLETVIFNAGWILENIKFILNKSSFLQERRIIFQEHSLTWLKGYQSRFQRKF